RQSEPVVTVGSRPDKRQRKNKTVLRWIVGQALCIRQLEEQAGLFQFGCLVSFPRFLELVQLLFILFVSSLGALAIEGHQDQLLRLVARDNGVDHSGLDPSGFSVFVSGAVEIADGGEVGTSG